MLNTANPFLGVYQNQIEASRRFLDTIFSSTEKIDRVVRDAARRAVSDQLSLAESFTQVKDPASISSAWQSGIASRNSDQAINYQRELLSIIVEMQNELGKGMQDYVEHLRNQTASGFTQQADASAQTAAANVANPLTDLLSVWQNAFTEASSMAQRNMSNASSTFANAIDAATQQTTRYVDATAGASRDMAQTSETSIGSAAVSDPNPSASRANESASSSSAAHADRKPGATSGSKKK